VLALLGTVQGRWLLVLAAVALGVMAKETALILVPAYFAYHWQRGLPTLLHTALIGLAAAAAYVAVRLPVVGRPGWNHPEERRSGWSARISVSVRLFSRERPGIPELCATVAVCRTFVPLIVWHWRRADRRLRALFLTVTPLLLLSSLCFSWFVRVAQLMSCCCRC
jgi:hypothetical protein